MAIAISPGLIIILVGSLSFFLLMVFYSGEYASRLFWTTGCFVFAATLISRVSIVEGAERASLFGIALGVVAGMAMMRFTNHPWGAWLVLGLIWWCASQLVWNCTLVEDDDDASGEGLLEAAGIDTPSLVAANALPAKTLAREPQKKSKRNAAPPSPPLPPQPVSKRFFAWWQKGLSRSAPPGLSVVYFSFGALPIFGLGQRLIADDGRRFAFLLMVAYVASALGLLLMTSFLGLRRYLRQRRLEMPFEMADTWLGVGAALGVAIVLLAMFIPRPSPEYAISSLTGSLGSPQREASNYAPLHDSPAQGDSHSTAQQNEPDAGETAESQNRAAQAGQDQQQSTGEATASGQGEAQASAGEASADKSPGSQGPSSPASNATASSGEKGDGQKSTSQPSPGGQSPQESQEQTASKPSPQSSAQQSPPPAQQQQQQQQDGQQPRADAQQKSDQQAQQQPSRGDSQQQQAQSPQQIPQQDQQQQANSQEQKSREQDQMSSRMAKDLSQQWRKPRLQTPSLPSNWGLLSAVKMLVYAIVILAGIYFLIRYWARVMAFLAAAWRELQALWRSLFGGRAADSATSQVTESNAIRARPFSAFADPFASGFAQRNSPNAVVQYSFEALEAWAAERGAARDAEETPLEFAARLTSDYPPLAEQAQELAGLYARVAYAREKLDVNSLTGVRQLWAMLRRPTGTPAAART